MRFSVLKVTEKEKKIIINSESEMKTKVEGNHVAQCGERFPVIELKPRLIGCEAIERAVGQISGQINVGLRQS